MEIESETNTRGAHIKPSADALQIELTETIRLWKAAGHTAHYWAQEYNKASEELSSHQARIAELETALRTIAERKGPYSRDPLTHASNTIDVMADTAVAALNSCKGDPCTRQSVT